MTAHAKSGARTDSNNTRSPTSAEVMNLGPIASNTELTKITAAWVNTSGAWLIGIDKGAEKGAITRAAMTYPMATPGTIDVARAYRAAVSPAANSAETLRANRSPARLAFSVSPDP